MLATDELYCTGHNQTGPFIFFNWIDIGLRNGIHQTIYQSNASHKTNYLIIILHVPLVKVEHVHHTLQFYFTQHAPY